MAMDFSAAIRWHSVLPVMLALFVCAFPMAALASDPGREESARGSNPEPSDGSVRYITRFGLEFQPRYTTSQFVPAPAPSMRCEFGAPFDYYDAWFTLPDGANLRFVDIFGHDGSPTEDMYFVLSRTCQPSLDSPGSSVNTSFGSVTSAGVSGNFVRTIDLTTSDTIVDAYQCKFRVRMRFAAEGAPCPANVMAIDKVRFQYRIDP